MMRLLVSSLFVFGVGVGCDASKQVGEYADKACACGTNKDCAKTVLFDFVDWAEKNKDARGDEARAEREAKRLLECVMKAGVDQGDLMKAAVRLQKLGS